MATIVAAVPDLLSSNFRNATVRSQERYLSR